MKTPPSRYWAAPTLFCSIRWHTDSARFTMVGLTYIYAYNFSSGSVVQKVLKRTISCPKEYFQVSGGCYWHIAGRIQKYNYRAVLTMKNAPVCHQTSYILLDNYVREKLIHKLSEPRIEICFKWHKVFT